MPRVPSQHQGEKDANQNPGTQEDLAMEVQITDLPIEVVAHFQFCERK